MRELLRRIQHLLRRGRFERDLADEMAFHREMTTRALEGDGVDPREAGPAAQRAFGSGALARDHAHDVWISPWVQGIGQDIRFALRLLVKDRMLTAAAVVALALGIGANAAVCSIVYAALFRPLPYRDPGRLVVAWPTHVATGDHRLATPADFNDWEAQNRVFDGMSVITPESYAITMLDGDYPERIQYQYVTRSTFELLGVRAAIGRTFIDANVRADNTVVLSGAFWQRRFGGDPAIVGKTILLAGAPYEVVGVMPSGFRVAFVDTDVWRAIDPTEAVLNNRVVRWLLPIARLKPGTTLQQAHANLQAIARRQAEAYPTTNRAWTVRIEPLSDMRATGLTRILWPLSGAVVFVLLIACTNVANLLAIRAVRRTKELAVRAVLGAGRARLTRQLILESLVLALLAGAASVLLGTATIRFLAALAPPQLAFVRQAAFELPIFVFTVGVSLATGLSIGLVVAAHAAVRDVQTALKGGTGPISASGRQRASTLLTISQVTLAFVLLVGAALLLRTLANIASAPLGFRPHQVLTAELDLRGQAYAQSAPTRESSMVSIAPKVSDFYQQLVSRTQTIPGVHSAGVASWLPLNGTGDGRRDRTFTIIGRPDPGPASRPSVLYNAVSRGYFTALAIPLVRGRLITDADDARSPWVVVINRAMAERFWPNENPIGQSLRLDIVAEEQPREIVGVVENIRQRAPQIAPAPEMYASFPQQPAIYPGHGYQNRLRMSLVVDAVASPSLVTDIRRSVAALDSSQAVFRVRTMDEVITNVNAPTRFVAGLLGLFAVLGVTLAALGIFALTSCGVVDRTRELGIRLALGARPGALTMTVIGRSAVVAGVGVVGGVVASLWLTRWLSSLLYGVEPWDVTTLALASLSIVAVAALAAWGPARRALRLNPVMALRCD